MTRASRVEFCCFGLPLINFGSYTICIEFMFVSLCIIILAVAPPQIVATMGALPSGFPKIIVAILGVLAFLWQIAGIISIKREQPRFYRTYIRINFVLVLVILVVTLAFFAASAAQHSKSLTACTAAYGSTPQGSNSMGNSTLQQLGQTICNVFIWVQVGAMGLLLAVIGLTQLYMCAIQRIYGKEMRRADQDQKMYNGSGADEIPLATRGSGIWDAPNTGYANTQLDLHNTSSDEGHHRNDLRSSYKSPVREEGQYNYPSYETYGANEPPMTENRRSGYGSYGGGHHRGESKQSAYYYAS